MTALVNKVENLICFSCSAGSLSRTRPSLPKRHQAEKLL